MRARRVLRTFDERGPDAARAVLDQLYRPFTRAASPTSWRWRRQAERLAGLAVIDRGDLLAVELDAVTGTPWRLGQLKIVGLLGLAVRVDATSAARQMEELAELVHQDDPSRTSFVCKELRALAKLVRCFHDDRELPDEPSEILHPFTWRKGFSWILGKRAESLALRQAGRGIEAVPIDAEIRNYTRAFD